MYPYVWPLLHLLSPLWSFLNAIAPTPWQKHSPAAAASASRPRPGAAAPESPVVSQASGAKSERYPGIRVCGNPVPKKTCGPKTTPLARFMVFPWCEFFVCDHGLWSGAFTRHIWLTGWWISLGFGMLQNSMGASASWRMHKECQSFNSDS